MHGKMEAIMDQISIDDLREKLETVSADNSRLDEERGSLESERIKYLQVRDNINYNDNRRRISLTQH